MASLPLIIMNDINNMNNMNNADSVGSVAMEKDARIYIAGHRGLVGSAIVRNLQQKGYTNLLLRTHAELDLTNQAATEAFFADTQPDYVFLAAGKVGGIQANNTYPAQFIRDNLAIQTNIIHATYVNQIKRLMFLGSSCIYPKMAEQPMREDALLTGPLEPTNRPYALAKIAGIEMCWSYNRQYGTKYLSVMPTNLYGPGDNYHLENSHVIPALIRKFHEAKVGAASEVVVWGTGTPRREFMYSEDMADACVFLMNLGDVQFAHLVAADRNDGPPPVINIGVGHDLTIRKLAEVIMSVIDYQGKLNFDATKPDGTMRKLMDVTRLNKLGWKANTDFELGITQAYADFLRMTNTQQAS